MVAVNYQASISRNLSLEAYAGSLILINTAGCRVLIGDTSPGFKPRCFAGLIIFNQNIAESPEEPDGTEAYLWTGVGAGYAFEHLRVFADLGYIAEGAKSRGLGYSTGVMLSGGILFDI